MSTQLALFETRPAVKCTACGELVDSLESLREPCSKGDRMVSNHSVPGHDYMRLYRENSTASGSERLHRR